MVPLSGHSVYHLDVLTLWFCLLAVSQAFINVALNKPAYQQYPVPGNDRVDASNAVDGRKSDLNGWGGQCAGSLPEQIATWWVDLTSIHNIHHITIYFRTDNKPWGPSNWLTKYFLGFSVYVSNTTDRLQGTLCYRDIFTLDTIPAVFTTTCPVHGQYVIYYNERLPKVTYPYWYSKSVYSDLCEVEVYECDRGSFGIDCNETCGHCREVNQCFHTNGTCLTGCIDGFEGDLCKTPCQRGFFEENCSKECIKSRNDLNDVTGLCEYKCLPGWTGYFCQTSCPDGFFGENCTSKCKDTCAGCNNVDGVCDRGCHPGWMGEYCDRDFFNTDAFCRKTNLTSNHEI